MYNIEYFRINIISAFFLVMRLSSKTHYLSELYALDIGFVYSNNLDPQKQIKIEFENYCIRQL